MLIDAREVAANGLTWTADALDETFTQEVTGLKKDIGVKAHWNLTELITSTANSFGSSAADVDQDGELEVIVSKDARCEFYCLDSDGSILWNTPKLSSHRPGYYGSKVKDIDQDGDLEFVATADSIWVLEAETGVEKWSIENIGGDPDEAPWTLGHVSSITQSDIIVARTVDGDFLISVYDYTGSLLWSTAIENSTHGHTITTANVDDDPYDEIFVPCNKKTVAIDHNGNIMWAAPLDPPDSQPTQEILQALDIPLDKSSVPLYHSDFAEVTELYDDGSYYVLHDYNGGGWGETTIQVLDALSGKIVDSFEETGHLQWLKAADLREDLDGQEIVYVTRKTVVMRNSNLKTLWKKPLSGAHQMGVGDWGGDGENDILVSTLHRGIERFASLDSNFVVYNPYGDVIYNMRYHYSEGDGYATAQMQSILEQTQDFDGDRGVDIPICFSNSGVKEQKFESDQDVHQYIMGFTDPDYSNEFHHWGNDSTDHSNNTTFVGDALQLDYLVPTTEYSDTNGLLFHMNEGAGDEITDESSQTIRGNIVGGEWVKDGKFGTALHFNSTNEFCRVPFISVLKSEQVAIDVWVRASNISKTQYIVDRPYAFDLRITEEGILSFSIYNAAAERGSRAYVEVPFSFDNTFTHISASYDGKWLQLVVNGDKVSRDSHIGTINQVSSDLYIGNSSDGNLPMNGVIDELRMSPTPYTLPRKPSGEWLSKDISFPVQGCTRYDELIFKHTLNDGHIYYNLVDDNNIPIARHTHIVSSPHDISDVTETIKLRISLNRGEDPYSSPAVDRVTITKQKCLFLPITFSDSESIH
jgi:hypothetical protein